MLDIPKDSIFQGAELSLLNIFKMKEKHKYFSDLKPIAGKTIPLLILNRFDRSLKGQKHLEFLQYFRKTFKNLKMMNEYITSILAQAFL